MRIHKMENTDKALFFLKKKNVSDGVADRTRCWLLR